MLILLCVAVGFFTNKIYLCYAEKEISAIKKRNPQKSNEELKSICAIKGGTSIGYLFLGLLVQIGISVVVLFIISFAGMGSDKETNKHNTPINNRNETNQTTSTQDAILLEDVILNGYGCSGSKCNVYVENLNGNDEEYALGIDNSSFFKVLGNYKDYIKLNIYYNKTDKSKTIVDYKIYLKSSNEDISSISTENELRNKIGLYTTGKHTEVLTLKKIGDTSIGFSDDKTYEIIEYIFIGKNNTEYEMKDIDNNVLSTLIEGNKYSVTFEVKKDTFGYEYIIKSIK